MNPLKGRIIPTWWAGAGRKRPSGGLGQRGFVTGHHLCSPGCHRTNTTQNHSW